MHHLHGTVNRQSVAFHHLVAKRPLKQGATPLGSAVFLRSRPGAVLGNSLEVLLQLLQMRRDVMVGTTLKMRYWGIEEMASGTRW